MICRKCKMEIPKGATICPYCGSKQGSGCATIVLVIIIIVIGIPFMKGFLGIEDSSSTPTRQSNTTAATTEKKDFEFVGDVSGNTDEFSTTITGKLKNTSGKKYSYVQITFGLYDAEGNKLGTALANVNDLGNGETWKFEAFGMETGVKSFKYESIDAF